MIYHVTSEKYYHLVGTPESQAPHIAQQIFLAYPFDEAWQIEQWEFVPFLTGSSSFCIEFQIRTPNHEIEQLLFTVDFSETGAKATCFEPVA